MNTSIHSTVFLREYEPILKNFYSPKLSLGKKAQLINNNENLWKIDVFIYKSKDDLKFVQQVLLDIWAYYLRVLEKPDISFYIEVSIFTLLIYTICRHEYKMEYLCKCQGVNSIGISKRGSHITTMYRDLLAKSRDLCFQKMKSRIATNEECNFCGCTFAVSFIREAEFQKPTLDAICEGFTEWCNITSQINVYRGIHNAQFHKSVKLIVREIAVSMFGVFSCDTLDSYFQLCREDDMRSPTQSVKVQRKVADMSFSGVLNSISSTLLPKHASISKGSSESFFGTTAAFTEASTPSVDSTDEGGAFSLTSSLHLPAHHVRLSSSPQFSPNPLPQELPSSQRGLRRSSARRNRA
ncbi:hypothetical protein BLSTO_04900 [Blastocystis sp. subtype 1]